MGHDDDDDNDETTNELDDLFGAIDDNNNNDDGPTMTITTVGVSSTAVAAAVAEEVNEDEPRRAKRSRGLVSNNNNNNDDKKKDAADYDDDNGDKYISPTAAETTTAAPAADTATTTTTTTTTTTKKATSTSSAAQREIATGTSHDKSVRSYSAYPKQQQRLGSPATTTKLPPPNNNNNKEANNNKKTPAAKVYPFPLDPFQQRAIAYIDVEESVLVAAHTSAGKTAVAEYAIALSLQKNQRVIYTSPIKALSNQKFRDLQEEFQDVGLMTGDVTINGEAAILVMTTEILRSMLYRGSAIIREVAWIIFDEVHYMRDTERGVVWEESIILLPHSVKFVFLSATIPNANQFADWIAHIHHQPCHVIYTNYRPTPLQHYIFPQGGDGLHLVVDEKGKFREKNFETAMASLQSSSNIDAAIDDQMANSGNGKKRLRGVKGKPNHLGGGGPNNKKKGGPLADLFRIVSLIMERNLNPVIIFSFSKKDCEKYALALHDEDYTDDVEKDLIGQVYKNAMESLAADDRQLPQVEALLPLLQRGIGIHHGGLLPILKEVVEILFSEGLIKALFATETFSIGINMPAKTVVFTNTRKFDGKDFRWVTSGEYIQMSGRAGRRGKDDRGIVIQMLDEKMEPDVCKDILYGAPNPLNSSYHISYNMLLNLMRVEDVDPEYLLRASFFQFQRELEVPALMQQAEEFEREASAVDVGLDNATIVAEYCKMDDQLAAICTKMSSIMRLPQHVQRFLQEGRFMRVSLDGTDYGWGVLISHKRRHEKVPNGTGGGVATAKNEVILQLDVILCCVDRQLEQKPTGGSNSTHGKDNDDIAAAPLAWRGDPRTCRPFVESDDPSVASWRIFSITLDNVDRVSAIKIVIPNDCKRPEARNKVGMMLKEAKRRFQGDFQLLDPVTDLGINDESFQVLLRRAEALTTALAQHKLSTDFDAESIKRMVKAYRTKTEIEQKAKLLRDEARASQTIAMKEDMRKMKRVLKKLGHVDANGIIQTKGRTACEINTANELVVVELIFTGLLNTLTIEQSIALLSCLIFDERNKGDEDPAEGLNKFLSNPFFKLQEIARSVAKMEASCGINVDEDEFVGKLNPRLMEAVFAWCKGAKFIEVQQLTNSFEGTTIRILRRLEELVRQVAVAAKAIGNTELQEKFEKGGDLIRRDIVFCSSLYL